MWLITRKSSHLLHSQQQKGVGQTAEVPSNACSGDAEEHIIEVADAGPKASASQADCGHVAMRASELQSQIEHTEHELAASIQQR